MIDGVKTARELVTRRWTVVREALTPATAAALVEAAPSTWRDEESPTGGGVTFSSSVTGMALGDSAQEVRRVGTQVLQSLDVDAPPFNEVTWNRYAPGEGHISMHRDPPGVGGVIAVFTLYGEATFTIEDQAEFPVAPGDLVLLAGNTWPHEFDRCIRHAASRPLDGERMILTFRHNLNGAGASYF
ncbi:MAG: hypothetical protein J2P17_05215 [Mycobacterium sp.]|nr:hypothetical protein [Mycobacterium sp.]